MCVWCVTVTCVSTVSLSQTQLDLCQGFHQYIFSRVLRLTDTLEFLDSQVVCYIVVYCTVVYCTVLYRLGAGGKITVEFVLSNLGKKDWSTTEEPRSWSLLEGTM